MRKQYLQRQYKNILTLLSLTAILMLGYTNCAEIKIAPLELQDPTTLPSLTNH